MSHTGSTPSRDLLTQYVTGKINRASLFKAVGLGLAAAAVPDVVGAQAAPTNPAQASFPFFPATSGVYTTESIPDIVSNLLTLSYVDASIGAAVLASGGGGLTGVALAGFQAGTVIEQSHIDVWSATVPDATPLTSGFTLNTAALGSPQAFFTATEITATVRQAAWITAAREFAELGQPTLAKNAAQTATSYEGLRVLFRTVAVGAGITTDSPPDNKAFATDLFLYTRDAVGTYKGLGLLGGSGTPISYPGRAAVLAAAGSAGAAVVQKKPNNAGSTITVTSPTDLIGERT